MLTVSIILSLCLITSSQQANNIYLLPETSPSVTQCPVGVKRCYTFRHLQDHGDLFPEPPDYSINTKIVLLAGTHINNETLLFSHATNLSLVAANSSIGATVQCHGSAGFAFEHILGLSISGIEFRGCESFTQRRNSNIQVRYSLHIYLSRDIELRNITMKHGQSIGLLVVHAYGYFSIVGCRFLSSDTEHFSLYMYIEEREVQYTSITIINSELTGPDDSDPLPALAYGLAKLKMTQEGADYFVKIMVKNVVADTRGGSIDFVLCGIRCTYNLLTLSFKQEMHTCEHVTKNVIILSDATFQDSLLSLSNSEEAASLILSNVLFQNASLFKSYDFHLILHNAIFQDGSHWSVDNMTIQGLLLYQRNTNDISLSFSYNNVILDRNAHVVIADNYMPHKDAPFTLYFAEVIVLHNSTIIFKNNTGKLSGGLLLHSKSRITFRGSSSITFENNRGSRGGALALYGLSVLKFNGSCSLIFIQNHATIDGGAIFVQDDDYLLYSTPTDSGYVQFYDSGETNTNTISNCSGSEPINFKFSENSAIQAGSSLYGGWISNNNSCFRFEFDQPKKNDLSFISSNPTRVCICNEDSKPDCDINRVTVNVVPGQIFEIEVVAVGQMFGVVPSFVQAEFVGEGNGEFEQINLVQSTKQRCTKLAFILRSDNAIVSINLTANKQTIPFDAYLTPIPHIEQLYTQLQIEINLEKCPIGFYFSNVTKSCDCQQILIDHNVQCETKTLTLRKNSPSQWISTTTQYLQIFQDLGIIVHDHCPFDYCLPAKSINLTFPDQQCAFNRAGILCGMCESNLSQVLGTSNCKRCSSAWIALILPLTALAGIALVLGLMLLNITVSAGTINGLIFYANVVRANQAIFFPHHASNSFLSVFIAWLNLDFGIELCFYHEFNAYAKTWLQFMFPLYICFIVAVIIIITKYSLRASKLLGSNCVQVLATLFLLSYSKLLRNIITVFSSTVLVYPNQFPRRVWLYDGNIDYLAGKHIPLFITALLFLVFISIPYTVTLLCFQYLQKVSNMKLFFWVKELYPLFDAYAGPYKGKHRYWTGLLLLARVALFIIYSVNTTHNPTVNLLTNVIATSILLAYLAVCGGVYKHWLLELIESSFILNVCILSAGVLYYLQNGGGTRNASITYTSTGIAFAIFVAIVVYHIVSASQRCWKKSNNKRASTAGDEIDDDRGADPSTTDLSQLNQSEEVTYSVVELREPLISY